MRINPISPIYRTKRRKRNREPEDTELGRLIAQAREKGKERDYLDWLKTQPSALDWAFGYWDMATGQGYNDPAHWRTSRYAGWAQKPEWLAVPLTQPQHRQAHQHGDSTIGDRDWWEQACIDHLKRWIAL